MIKLPYEIRKSVSHTSFLLCSYEDSNGLATFGVAEIFQVLNFTWMCQKHISRNKEFFSSDYPYSVSNHHLTGIKTFLEITKQCNEYHFLL